MTDIGPDTLDVLESVLRSNHVGETNAVTSDELAPATSSTLTGRRSQRTATTTSPRQSPRTMPTPRRRRPPTTRADVQSAVVGFSATRGSGTITASAGIATTANPRQVTSSTNG